MARASLDKQPDQVAAMFDAVAARYDRTNTVLSGGQDRRWRRHAVRALALHRGQRVLDVAAGTAVSTAALAATGAWCVATDFSLGMLGASRHPELPRVAGDAMRLPFADGVFDAVTISFGLRNVLDPSAALSEFARVTRPGGQLLVCEFSRPRPAPVRWAYHRYLRSVLPWLAGRVSSDPSAYTYLQETIEQWPDQVRLAGLIAGSGWSEVAWRNMTFGVVALHHAIRTEDAPPSVAG
ncbi:demethylmenaquinone methyltransferase [Nakamurella leprariae]|uniref:Demethylmenaquinone methyltransferase n=1 Tax=Nakamurella leprariae TaxID=2803911 RepID=A0A939BV76_9ACTN|nr:demethylmenaquinone methyltransferase [Nakamurella leprariae]MBM9466253.1 demethylmenaquinone methyltransferase [Nakamurella leprariae]